MDYQNQGGGKEEDNAKTNLIINYLPQHLTDKELYSMFVTIGTIQSCRVMKDYKVSSFSFSTMEGILIILCILVFNF